VKGELLDQPQAGPVGELVARPSAVIDAPEDPGAVEDGQVTADRGDRLAE
jgi:hypothetical protein